MFIIKQWGLRPGDHLDWSIDIHGNQKVAVVIRAVKVLKSRGNYLLGYPRKSLDHDIVATSHYQSNNHSIIFYCEWQPATGTECLISNIVIVLVCNLRSSQVHCLSCDRTLQSQEYLHPPCGYYICR